jgi:hypothetical protein
MRLPWRRGKPSGLHVARGSVSHAGDNLTDRLVQLGVPINDTVADRYGAGLLGRVTEHVGLPHLFLAEGGEIPRGSKVTKALSPVERMAEGGFVWDGSEGER